MKNMKTWYNLQTIGVCRFLCMLLERTKCSKCSKTKEIKKETEKKQYLFHSFMFHFITCLYPVSSELE